MLSSDSITIVNASIDNNVVDCGLIVVERFAKRENTVFDIESGTKLCVRLSPDLCSQPLMISFPNKKIQIIAGLNV